MRSRGMSGTGPSMRCGSTHRLSPHLVATQISSLCTPPTIKVLQLVRPREMRQTCTQCRLCWSCAALPLLCPEMQLPTQLAKLRHTSLTKTGGGTEPQALLAVHRTLASPSVPPPSSSPAWRCSATCPCVRAASHHCWRRFRSAWRLWCWGCRAARTRRQAGSLHIVGRAGSHTLPACCDALLPGSAVCEGGCFTWVWQQ